MQQVTFVKKFPPFNAGETAGFLPHVAADLIKSGVAVDGKRPVRGASPMPGAENAQTAARKPQKGDHVSFLLKGEGSQFGTVEKVDKGVATVAVGDDTHQVALEELAVR